MSEISKIKFLDPYGYEIANLDIVDTINSVPTNSQEIVEQGLSYFGINIHSLHQIDEIKSKANISDEKIKSLESKIYQITYDSNKAEEALKLLSSRLEEMSESLNQKIDLEISKQKYQNSNFPMKIDEWYNNFLSKYNIKEL